MDKIALMVYVIGLIHQLEAAEISEEIFNGNDAAKGQIPFQALLICQYPEYNAFCGGCLISQYHVLTAAHCCYQAKLITVYVGLTDTQDPTGALYYTVKINIFIHPNYNWTNYQNDLCILQLSTAVPINSQINTILLPKMAWAPPNTFNNYNGTASGWGQTYNNEVGIHQTLQFRTVNIMPQTDCVKNYTGINAVTDGMICTDKTVVYAGPCHGDSGGPLTVNLTSGRYVIGIVSWSYNNCMDLDPVVYCNVAPYLNWISSVTGIPVN